MNRLLTTYSTQVICSHLNEDLCLFSLRRSRFKFGDATTHSLRLSHWHQMPERSEAVTVCPLLKQTQNVIFTFGEKESLYIALAAMVLSMESRVISNSQRSACLCSWVLWIRAYATMLSLYLFLKMDYCFPAKVKVLYII